MKVSPTSLARSIDLDGLVKIVQPVGTHLRPGNEYYNPHVHTNLRHINRDVAVRLRLQKPSRGGSSTVGVRQHFSAAGMIRKKTEPQKETVIDRTKGYRIHINTSMFSDVFNPKSGIYEISEGGHALLSDPDMRDREPRAISKIEDIVELMKEGNFKRLKDSKIIFRNKAYDWDDFMILAGKPTRWKNLLTRLQARKKGEAPPLCVLEIKTTGYHRPDPYKEIEPAPINEIDMGVDDGRGKRHTIQPSIYLDNKTNTDVRDALIEPNSYFVLGVVRYKKYPYRDKVMHAFNVTVTAPGHIMSVNIENIARHAQLNDQRRARGGRQPTLEST